MGEETRPASRDKTEAQSRLEEEMKPFRDIIPDEMEKELIKASKSGDIEKIDSLMEKSNRYLTII